MLTIPASAVPANSLSSSYLQNVLFCLAKCAVLQAKTGHIAVRNGSSQNANRHIRKVKAAEAVFSCIFASMGRLRIFIYNMEPKNGGVATDILRDSLPRSSWELADEHKKSRQSPFVGSLVGIARAASGTRTRTAISGPGILSPPLRQQVRLRVCKGIIISCNGQIFP